MNFEEKKTTYKEVTDDWKFRRVVEKFEVGIEQINNDAVETSSKNLNKVSRKSSTRSTSDSTSRPASDGRRNLANAISPDPLKGCEPKLTQVFPTFGPRS